MENGSKPQNFRCDFRWRTYSAVFDSARRGRIFLESGLKPKPTSLGRCAGLVSQPTMASGMASVFNYQTEGRCNCV